MNDNMKIKVPDNLIPGVINLDEQDGNGMFLISAVRRALRKAGNTPDVLAAFSDEAMSDDHDHLLRTCIAYTISDKEY